MKALLVEKLVPSEHVEDVLEKALGWVKSRIESAIEIASMPAISVDDFLNEIGAFVSKLRTATLLNDFAGKPVCNLQDHALRTYVAQLRLIDADDEEIFRAVNSYLRSSTNRAEWSKRFLVYAESFDEYESALRTFWVNTKKQQDFDHSGESLTKRGQRLMLACVKHRRTLEGREVPDDFTPGSFHALADEPSLGWHPEYEQKLKDLS